MAQSEIIGPAIRPSAGVQDEYIKAILTIIKRMHRDIKTELEIVFKENDLAGNPAHAMDGSPSAQARIAINGLRKKYSVIFSKVAKLATKRMISRTLKSVNISAQMTLREMSEGLKLDPSYLQSDWMQEIITAGAAEAAGLIKLIPEKYLTDVQGEVMRSVTTGKGMKDLVPYLNEKYNSNIKHARNVAMDQTRKVHASMSAAAMTSAGVKEYKWIHTGGSTHPRKDHIEMNGKVYRYDDPPVVGIMYGKEVRGGVGYVPNCRCLARPVFNFKNL